MLQALENRRAGGRRRTGAMVAVYRMSIDGWTVEQAYDEMKRFKFYTSWGHGCYKDYVYDYYRKTVPLDGKLVGRVTSQQVEQR
jgi:hypothetical protein